MLFSVGLFLSHNEGYGSQDESLIELHLFIQEVYIGYSEMVTVMPRTQNTKMQGDSSCPQRADKVGREETS